MIVLRDISKSYQGKNGAVHAVKGVSLQVKKGEIMGVIGYSGAGKSTLIRCLNLLENPDSGDVVIAGNNLTELTEKELRKARKEIGMIFQHFNLLRSRNVFKNIAYPLKGSGLSKAEIQERVTELLKLVGLEDKASSYPSQLSGGQKQRVAIARALANNPKVLLCDEATSALDPETTVSILSLLREINEKLGLTIVLITHQMEVIKEICHRVAVMEEGEIVEEGSVVQIFSRPGKKITRKFVSTLFNMEKITPFLDRGDFIARLSYVGTNTEEAYISRVSRNYEIDASILFGNIEMINKELIGNLVVKFEGEREKIAKAVGWLCENNINVEVLKDERAGI